MAGVTEPATPPGLAGKRAAARAALWFEQLWPIAWPPLGLIGAFIAAALLDLPSFLPPWPRLLLPVLVLAGAGILLWWGLRRLVRPGAGNVDRRLERDSGLRHRPLSALQDQPAAATAESLAVWQVHQSRLRRQIGRLRVARPRPGLAARDVWALRGLLVVALAASTVIAGREAPARLRTALLPGLPAGPAAPGTVVQAWITPPAYTGLPPFFLQPATPSVAVPTGAHLTASVTGGRGGPALALGAETTEFRALDAASWQADRDLVSAGRLIVRRNGQELAAWALTIIPDLPPTATFVDPPGPAQAGGRATLQTRLAWKADDDYGVAGVHAELRLRDRPDAPPIVLAAPFSGSPKQARGAIVQDLTAHPWAGLSVTGRIIAKDAAGQTGTSADGMFDLPERTFQNPAAQAVIAVRKQLSRTPNERVAAREAMDAIADRPTLYDGASSILLNMRAIAYLLARGRGQVAVDEAQGRMWELALALEEGTADRTAKALETARQAMRDAMEAAKQDPANEAAKSDLDRKMQELREAVQRHLEALAEQARREGTEMPFDPNALQMNARDLDKMAQRLQDAAREGRMEDAQKQMAELERLLEQLQNSRPEHGEQREKRNAERRQQGKQQTDAVQDMVRREGDLLDRSRARTEDPASQRPQRSPDQNAQQDSGSQREQDQRGQKAMRRALGELMQRFGDMTGQIPAPLGEADQAMRDAGQAMADGRDAAAGAAQQRAIEALQKGGREMSQQMARQFGRGSQPGDGEGDDGQEGQEGQESADGQDGQGGQGNNAMGNRDGQTSGPRPGEQPGASRRRTTRRDPLGRPLQQGTSGSEESGDVRVPDQMEMARTRALQEELRRRGAERGRPQQELDYIDRLLKTY